MVQHVKITIDRESIDRIKDFNMTPEQLRAFRRHVQKQIVKEFNRGVFYDKYMRPRFEGEVR